MNDLNKDWTPGFGTIYTWFAMDKNGLIAVMVNNCWGDIPKCLLKIPDLEFLLDDINEYMWEESKKYINYPENKNGKVELDLYSSLFFKKFKNKEEYIEWVFKERMTLSHEMLPSIKGFFVYYAVEGDNEGDDYPIEYDGPTKMGDYYRYLLPTIYASINDFPKELWHGIAVSDTLDFTKDRLLDNSKINSYFLRNYQ